jgi:hypothetical protein
MGMKDKEYTKLFDKCPECGCTERVFESMGKEVTGLGLSRPDWKFTFDVRSGIVEDVKAPKVPIGTELPTFSVMTDICGNCGMIYCTGIRRGTYVEHSPTGIDTNFKKNFEGRIN